MEASEAMGDREFAEERRGRKRARNREGKWHDEFYYKGYIVMIEKLGFRPPSEICVHGGDAK